MRFLIVFAAVVALAIAAPTSDDAAATIAKSTNENQPDGSYTYSQELTNGIAQSESGSLKTVPDAEAPVIVATGSYSYTAPDGQKIQVQYVADENGFQPIGDHLPKTA